MTPDKPKCEHPGVSWQHPDRADGEGLEEVLACSVCGQRFVPSDVLEEAGDFILWTYNNCSFTGPVQERMLATLRRIDEVLGK